MAWGYGQPAPKPLPRVFDKRQAKAEERRSLRAAYAEADRLAGHRCECCGRKSDLEHHHVIPRSLGGTHVVSNIAVLCRYCHALVQRHYADMERTPAGSPTRWRFSMSAKSADLIFSQRPIPAHVHVIPEGV